MKAGQGYPPECIAAIRQRAANRDFVFQAIFWSQVAVGDPRTCWKWKRAIQANGYGEIKYKGKPVSAHRIAYQLAHGVAIPDGMHVAHKCDFKACCNPLHLEIATPKENVRQAFERNLMPSRQGAKNGMCGKPSPNRKINQDIADKIRRSYANGIYTQKQIAVHFSVSQRTVSAITLGLIWNHGAT